MLTWEAKKEAIFEMPVRPRRRVSRARFSRARDVDARASSRARDSMVMTRTWMRKQRLTCVYVVAFSRIDRWCRDHAQGPEPLKLARKEQCLALLNNFRAKMKLDGCITACSRPVRCNTCTRRMVCTRRR